MKFYRDYKEIIDKIIFVSITIAALYIFFSVIYTYISPFVWGFLLSLILTKPVNFITANSKIPRSLAVIFSMLIVILIAAIIFNLLIGRIFKEAFGFFEYLPFTIQAVNNGLEDISRNFDFIYDIVPGERQAVLAGVITDFVSSVTASVGNAVKNISTNFVTKIPSAVVKFVLTLISVFFFTKDKELIKKSISNMIPKYFKANLSIVKEGIISGVIGYLKAQGILMGIIAVICVTGLTILKAPYSLFLGILIAFVDAIPVFGSGAFYWPWIVYSMLMGDYRMAMGLGVIYISVLLTRQILEPKILGVQIGIHPIITLMSIYIGLRVFGILGIFLGPCVVIIIKAIYKAPPLNN